MGLTAVTFPAFRPRPPWLTGDLQTLRNVLRKPRYDLSRWQERRIEIPLSDASGDRLVGHWHRPDLATPNGIVIAIHGLTGCADSFYILSSTQTLLEAGYAVVRINLRGAGASRPVCRFQYHAGRTSDVRDTLQAMRALDPALARRGTFAIGFSLGGSVLLKYLAEEGRAAVLHGAVAVSAPLDLHAASRRIMAARNHAYHRYLLGRMYAEALAPGAEHTEEQRRTICAVRNIFDFDDRVVAPRNGYTGALDYYARCSAGPHLGAITTPTLVIHALDDPWIPAESYLSRDWGALGHVKALLPARGGHVGFHGADSKVPWHDRCAALFFNELRLVNGG